MVDISDLFSSDSDSDENEDEQPEGSGSGQSQPHPVDAKEEHMEEDGIVLEVPTTTAPGLSWSFPILVQGEGLFKPDVVEIKKTLPDAKKRSVSVLEAMGRERYRLRAHGEEHAAEELYEKRSLIEKHVEHAHEIVFNDRDIIGSIRAFIEERFFMRFGPDMIRPGNVNAKVLSEEEKEEQEFLIEHSVFITRVILRMNNFDPDRYKSKIQNFHLMAKNKIVFHEKSLRDKEMELMNEKRQATFRKKREERLMRIRGGQESSDDELLEEGVVEHDEVEYLKSHTPEVMERLKTMMTEMGLNPSVDRLLDEVKNMLGQVQIKSSLGSRERCPSPPRNAPLDLTGDEKPEDLPWVTDEQSGGDELLTDEATEDEKLDIRAHFCTLDWSEDLFPDDDVAAVGEKRPIHVSDEYDVLTSRTAKIRAVEKHGFIQPENMDTAKLQQRKSCLRQPQQLLTDVDQNLLDVKERLKWRNQLECNFMQKKRVTFRDFDDPENRCRFYTRPTDFVGSTRNVEWRLNQARDAGPNALYADYSLGGAYNMIHYMSRSVPPAASDTHNPDKYIEEKLQGPNGEMNVSTYKLLHPQNFLRVEVRESKTPNGVHLPAAPGKRVLQIPNMTSERRAYVLSRFRANMRSFRQDRSGISIVRHVNAPVMVAGILILSDTLLQEVATEKLSNTVLECFEPTQGIEDILAVIDRCTYDEMDIRHCVLAWGHDLIVYHRQNPIYATGRATAALMHLHTTLERKKEVFEQDGYRRRKPTQLWILTIPEIGNFAGCFKIFNNIIRCLFTNHNTIYVLDWAAETEKFKTEKRRSPYTKAAVEARLVQLFDLCRRQLDLMYFRYQDQKLVERRQSWERHDYDDG